VKETPVLYFKQKPMLTGTGSCVGEMENIMSNEMYLNNEYRAEYYDEDLGIWVQLDDLTHIPVDNELEAIDAAVEYLACSDYEAGKCDSIIESKKKWYDAEWRAAKEINPKYNDGNYNWKYE
jgi:hypothetical protein